MPKISAEYSEMRKNVLTALSPENLRKLQDEMKLVNESRILQEKKLEEIANGLLQNTITPVNKPSLINDFVRLQESFNSARKSLSWIEDFTRVYGKLLEPVQKFGEVLEGVAKVREDPEYQNFPFLMALDIDMQTMKSLSDQWLSGNKENVKQKMWEITSGREFQEDFVKDLDRYAYFHDRLEIIKDALWAHSNGKFALSIPVLYLIIDGAFTTQMNLKGKGKNISIQLNQDPKFNKSLFDLYGAIRFFVSTYSPKRSMILHGLVPDYGKDRELSTVLVLSLGSTTRIIDKIKNSNP